VRTLLFVFLVSNEQEDARIAILTVVMYVSSLFKNNLLYTELFTQ
jgi:hypothetical protein